MTIKRIRVDLCVLGLALALPATMAGQQPVRTAPPYGVGQALPPLDEGKTFVGMTLADAIGKALDSNLDIQIARLNPTIQQYALRVARAAFSPTISGTYGYTNSSNQSTSQLDGGARTTSQRQVFNTSVSQTVPWYGGRLGVNFNNNRTESNNSFSVRNPSYNSTVSFNYTQPLLSGFGTDNQRASLETQEIQSRITDLQVQAQIENITNQVREAYWNLRSAIEQIEIQRLSLAQAQQLLADNQVRVRLGRMTEMQIVQTEAQVASAEQAFLNVQIQWRNQEFAFKRLLLAGMDDPLLGETINPTDQPIIVEQAVDIEAAIQRALAQRTDIVQEREQREISEVNLAVSRTNTLPDLTLTAAYSLQGVGGDLFQRSELGGSPELIRRGGYFDGIESIADFDTPTWSLTLNASYPLGTNSDKANLERAQLQLRQAELALQSQELAVVTQVTTTGLNVQNGFLQLEAARRSREASERNVEAELLRFDVGVATNFEVVTAQDALTTARLSELRAVIDYVNAIADFERVQRVGG